MLGRLLSDAPYNRGAGENVTREAGHTLTPSGRQGKLTYTLTTCAGWGDFTSIIFIMPGCPGRQENILVAAFIRQEPCFSPSA